jgi:hypothetical protein
MSIYDDIVDTTYKDLSLAEFTKKFHLTTVNGYAQIAADCGIEDKQIQHAIAKSKQKLDPTEDLRKLIHIYEIKLVGNPKLIPKQIKYLPPFA